MREKMVVMLILVSLFTTLFGMTIRITPVHAPPGGIVHIVPSPPTPTLFAAITIALPNDEIHIMPGWIEPPLVAPLLIWQNDLWIIGGPTSFGPPPMIELAGFAVTITGNNVYITGLNIMDSAGAAIPSIVVASTGCIIRNNIIKGVIPPSTGIQVTGPSNTIALNTMSWWGVGIDLFGPGSFGNIVIGNIISPNYNWGIQVSGGAGMNQIYYNNLMAAPFMTELWDANPAGSPPNAFDDTSFSLGGLVWGPSGGPGWNKGNYEGTWGIPPPYVVPPATNGYLDFWPLAAPWTQLSGDINLDGQVDIFDIVIIASVFPLSWCQLGWDPKADLNTDGTVDIFDIVIVAASFGSHM